MLDDDAAARHSLEQEAIALVNLSNPKQFRSRQEPTNANIEAETDATTTTTTASKAAGAKSSSSSASSSSIHPLLRIKANLMARRDAKLRTRDATDVADLEATAPESEVAIKMESAAVAGMSAEQLDAQLGLVDGNISMKSLLVTLKKRKLHATDQRQSKQRPTAPSAGTEPDKASAGETDASKLPSFRDVFQPQPVASVTTGAAVASATASGASASGTATSAELKCKYRTGKCHNVRALKSCGDYHNLCNYHRLRANANQRKLDRKKKVQRMQQQTAKPDVSVGPAGAVACSSRTSSPRAATGLQAVASSQAAAAALASLVAARPHQHAQCPQYEAVLPQQQRLAPPTGAVPDVVATGMSTDRRNRANSSGGSTPASCVRPKPEDACSY